MSKILICDSCGKEIDEYNEQWLSLSGSTEWREAGLIEGDLHQECFDMLIAEYDHDRNPA